MDETGKAAPYVVDERILKRFDQRKTVFGRMLFDADAPFHGRSMYEKAAGIIAAGRDGYSRERFAEALAAWTVYNHFHGAFSKTKLTGSESVMAEPDLPRHPAADPHAMSVAVKRAAKRYGAALVGICRLDRRWIYARDLDGAPVRIPQECRYAVVMAVAMDPAAIAASPRWEACAETGVAYSRMALCVACVAEFIRNLGYRAVPAGNDLALSIPLAIDAGLGGLGRNGLLVTRRFGPCVRLCKVFTDLPLRPDEPSAGVWEFCRRCMRCAEACEADAVRVDAEPSFEIACVSNNPGVLKWTVNHDRCYRFWIENGGECSNCIAACPWTPKSGGERRSS